MSLKVSFEVNLAWADNNHRKVLSITADFPYLLTVLKVLKWLET